MMVGIELLVGIAGACVAVMTFFIGRQNSAKHEGAMLAKVQADVEYMSTDIKYIRDRIEKNDAKFEDSLRRLHARIDEHVERYHGGLV